jgi:hypothetical protein
MAHVEGRDVGPVRKPPRSHRQREHPLENGQFVLDHGRLRRVGTLLTKPENQ